MGLEEEEKEEDECYSFAATCHGSFVKGTGCRDI